VLSSPPPAHSSGLQRKVLQQLHLESGCLAANVLKYQRKHVRSAADVYRVF
jgi:hypothetical protein